MAKLLKIIDGTNDVMINSIKKIFSKLYKSIFKIPSPEKEKDIFIKDPDLALERRYYPTYETYLHHQAEKLGKVGEIIVQSDQEYEEIVVDRYKKMFDFHGKSILCLGARLGGEVRAFKKLGALAIGIDIEPGEKNIHVLYGDFHNLQFPDECFDFIFTNCVDHVFDLKIFLSEAYRVIKPEGIVLVELATVKPGSYEVLDMTDIKPILRLLKQYFRIIDQKSLNNNTDYISWEGLTLLLKKA